MTERALPSPASGAWLDDPAGVRPTVLLLGGFLTAPPMYRRLSERLLRRGAAAVVVSRVWTPDWMLAATRGSGAIATRAGRALLRARRESAEVSESAPVLVVGHSAGGLVARLLTAPEPFPGRRFGAARSIGAIVTLGSPHVVRGADGIGARIDRVLSGVAENCAPGTPFAPQTGYVSVASRHIVADPGGNGRERIASVLYRSVFGPGAGPRTEGDGLVPVEAAFLEGSTHVVLQGIAHGPGSGMPWYGSDEAVDVWWPAALEAWHGALLVRVAAAHAATDARRELAQPPDGGERDDRDDRLEAAS